MRKRAARCEICASKLDKKGDCPWEGCPKSPKYKSEEKETKTQKEKENEKTKQ